MDALLTARVVVFICTGDDTHGRLKLAEAHLREDGTAEVRVAKSSRHRRHHVHHDEARERRRIREDDREEARAVLDVTCPRCPNSRAATAERRRFAGPRGCAPQGVRRVRIAAERLTLLVAGLLEQHPDRGRVVFDVSRAR